MQPFINRPFIINITPHPHVTTSHIITLTLPTLKSSISLIHSHFFFFTFTITMKTSKSTSSKKANKRTAKSSQPKPLNVVHPSPLITAPPSTSKEPQNSDTPSLSTMHAGTKWPNDTPKGNSSSKPTKRAKQVDPNSVEEISKEMSVGFELDKY